MPKTTRLVLALLFVALLAAGGYATRKTSTTEFCLSCHEMERYSFELKRSAHAKDKDKKDIGCSQCHLPGTMGLAYMAIKGYLGVGDLLAHYTGDTRDLDRRHMQEVARRFVLDENCLACHQDLLKNVKGEPLSAEGKKAHASWQGKDGNGRHGCAYCHANMAHLPVFDRRYDVNAKFAAKLPQTGEQGLQ